MIKLMPSAKKLIRYLSLLLISIWAAMYLYFISIRTPTLLYDYSQQLGSQQRKLSHNINIVARLNSKTPELVINYQLLCQNRICDKDFPEAEKYLQKMLKL